MRRSTSIFPQLALLAGQVTAPHLRFSLMFKSQNFMVVAEECMPKKKIPDKLKKMVAKPRPNYRTMGRR